MRVSRQFTWGILGCVLVCGVASCNSPNRILDRGIHGARRALTGRGGDAIPFDYIIWYGAVDIDKKYVASDVPTIANLLGSYEWHPSADLVYEDIQLGARDFLKAGILDKRTDPDVLAKKAYVDIFRQVAER